jgi:hypothetical protein
MKYIKRFGRYVNVQVFLTYYRYRPNNNFYIPEWRYCHSRNWPRIQEGDRNMLRVMKIIIIIIIIIALQPFAGP